MLRANRWTPIVLASAVLAGCSSEPPEVSRARVVLAEKPLEDPGYYSYALSVVAGSDAPHAREMTLAAIAGENRTAAAEAIRGLAGGPDEETAAALRVAFGQGGSVKALAASALASAGDAEALEWLASRVGQGGGVLPATGMAALAASEHQEAVRTALMAMIWHKDLSIRNEGYVLLGEVRAEWAVPMLLQGLDKEFGAERVEPIVALGRQGDPAAAEAISAWVNTQGLVRASLVALGSLGEGSALAKIEPMLEHESTLVRAYAAAACWKLGAQDAVMAAMPSLIAAEDAAARRALAEQLSGAAGDEATAWLAQLAGDADKGVRAEAYRSLIGRSGAGLAERFAEGAQDPDYEVSTVALAGLAQTGDASHTAALRPLLDSDNPYLAISAAHAVLALGGSQP